MEGPMAPYTPIYQEIATFTLSSVLKNGAELYACKRLLGWGGLPVWMRDYLPAMMDAVHLRVLLSALDLYFTEKRLRESSHFLEGGTQCSTRQ